MLLLNRQKKTANNKWTCTISPGLYREASERQEWWLETTMSLQDLTSRELMAKEKSI